jgi:hypothetical protein
MNNDLKEMWTEAVLSYIEVLYRQSPGGTEDVLKNPQNDWCSGRESSSLSPNYVRNVAP